MKKITSGLLVYRQGQGKVEVLLVHPGGPFWAKKDQGAWSIPKGEAEESEELIKVAVREFQEETGHPAPTSEKTYLESIKISSGKVIHVWAVEGDLDASQIRSNTFTMEWPPKSGKEQEFPEVDKAAWFDLPTAIIKVHKGQSEFIERLANHLGADLNESDQPSQQTLFD